MHAHPDPTHTAPESRSPQRPAYGTPSPALLARADRGFARFLAQHDDQDDEDEDHGAEDPPQ